MSQKKKNQTGSGQPLKPTTSNISTAVHAQTQAVKTKPEKNNLVFDRDNFKWMFIGMGVMLFGYILMSGGSMPDANTWDPSIIYSFRRITLAPFIILVGIAIEIYAIFYVGKKEA